MLVLDPFGGLGGVWGGFLLGSVGLGMTIREWGLLGAGPIAEASEASEQSERAKLSGACSGFPLLTHAFAGVPLLCLVSLPLLNNGLLAVSSFSCFTLRHILQQP